MKAASHLFVRVSGEQPEAGQPEEAPFLTLADRTDSGECACVRDSRVSDAQTPSVSSPDPRRPRRR